MSNPRRLRQKKKEYIFVNNIWLTGFYKHKKFIGRTVVINEIESIMIIDESSTFQTINFNDNDINDIYKLSVNVKDDYRKIANVLKTLNKINNIQLN